MVEQEIVRIQSGENQEAFLFDICLRLWSGKIHGLIVDNVLEERYLFEILQGKRSFSDGKVFINETFVPLEQTKETFAKKIFFPEIAVKNSQELTVMDSFFIEQKVKEGFYKNIRRLRRQIETMVEVFSVSWTPDMLLRDMNPLQRVELELIKAFRQGFKIIVLKNLTAVLNSKDIARVTLLFGELRQRGSAFLVIDYDQTFLLRLTDDISIISNGRTAFRFFRDEFNVEQIQKVLLKERRTYEISDTAKTRDFAQEILRFNNISTDGIPKINFCIHKGECLVLLDREGYYGNDVIDILQGENSDYRGRMYLRGQPYEPKSLMDAVNQGVCMIQENPIAYGKNLFHNMSGLKNLSIMITEKVSYPFLTRRTEKSIQKELSHIFTKNQLDTQVAALDPLTKQKLVYYKYFIYYPHLIICVKPLSGVDIRMKEFTEHMIQEYIKRGIAVLIITTNISEAYTFSGQVIPLEEQKTENLPR